MMKKSLGLIIVSICFIFGLTIAGSAQTETPGINKRQKNQQKRIRQGVKNGSITRGEFIKLQKGQKKTQKAKKRAKSDGEVTKKERLKIHRIENKNSRRIYRAKHNPKNRP